MTVYKCDKCHQIFNEKLFSVATTYDAETFDICNGCMQCLQQWLKEPWPSVQRREDEL